MINIAAFTLKFDPVEDRILLVGNLKNADPRIDFWLTRRLVLRLLSAMPEMLKKMSDAANPAPQPHQAELAQFYHESAQQNVQVDREDDTLTTLSTEVLHRLDVSHREGRYQLRFYGTDTEPTASGVLNLDELHQFLHLLHKGARTLDWGVPKTLFTAEKTAPTLQ
ncbi:hypothetical protein ACFVYJ_11690 [Pontibacter sp. JAM-7]|uniref:hypothetical protein n=1 Tax=Pontibacter sp. JAM-7 TaxID=3366581 RepID=UPI003AF4B29B